MTLRSTVPYSGVRWRCILWDLFQVYQDGVRNINVMFIFRHVTLPVITCLLLAVTLPYVIAAGVVPIIGEYCILL